MRIHSKHAHIHWPSMRIIVCCAQLSRRKTNKLRLMTFRNLAVGFTLCIDLLWLPANTIDTAAVSRTATIQAPSAYSYI